MLMEIDFYQFEREFNDFKPNAYSREALKIVFDYYEEKFPDYPIDVIELYHEIYESSVSELISENGIDIDDIDNTDDTAKRDEVRKFLDDNTVILGETSEGFVYQTF